MIFNILKRKNSEKRSNFFSVLGNLNYYLYLKVLKTERKNTKIIPMEKQAALDLLDFIHESPTNYHAILSIKQRLQANGFKQLFYVETWNIEQGGKYFVNKNNS